MNRYIRYYFRSRSKLSFKDRKYFEFWNSQFKIILLVSRDKNQNVYIPMPPIWKRVDLRILPELIGSIPKFLSLCRGVSMWCFFFKFPRGLWLIFAFSSLSSVSRRLCMNANYILHKAKDLNVSRYFCARTAHVDEVLLFLRKYFRVPLSSIV